MRDAILVAQTQERRTLIAGKGVAFEAAQIGRTPRCLFLCILVRSFFETPWFCSCTLFVFYSEISHSFISSIQSISIYRVGSTPAWRRGRHHYINFDQHYRCGDPRNTVLILPCCRDSRRRSPIMGSLPSATGTTGTAYTMWALYKTRFYQLHGTFPSSPNNQIAIPNELPLKRERNPQQEDCVCAAPKM